MPDDRDPAPAGSTPLQIHDEPSSEAGLSPDLRWRSACSVILGRQNTSPRRLVAPGPSADQLNQLITLAASAPDHGQLSPWRFIEIPAHKRAQLGEVFASALRDRDAMAAPAQLDSAREKAQHAPLLLVAVLRDAASQDGIPSCEKWIALGAALQNVLLGATALGLGAGLSSGRALASAPMRAFLRLAPDEQAACFVSLGTVGAQKSRQAGRRPPQALLCRL